MADYKVIKSIVFFFPLDTTLICAYKHVRQPSRKEQLQLGVWGMFSNTPIIPVLKWTLSMWPRTFIHNQVTG